MPAAPYYPNQNAPTLFAMAGDDCSLHFDLNKLTPKQQADHQSNVDLTAMLQVANIYIGKPTDEVALFDAFEEAPWADALRRYHRAFEVMGTDPVPLAHCHFHSKLSYYESVAALHDRPGLTTLYMTSGSNQPLHRDAQAFRISQAVNSKKHFALNAPDFGIPTPDTLLTSKGALDGDEVSRFFDKHNGQIILKTLGLAGARNVTAVDSVAEARAYVAEYDDAMDVILQERLPLDQWTEMTADLCVSDTDVWVSNIRQIMFADGIWVGNLIGPSVTLPEAHTDLLLKIGDYARAQGYSAPEGLNCGVDFFINGDHITVTEINARWTGGLFPAQMVERLGAHDRDAVAFMDTVAAADFPAMLDFFEPNLHGRTSSPYAIAPLGFGPYLQQIEGTELLFVWQMVVGDFDAFKADKQKRFGAAVLPAADKISLEL